MKDFIMKRQLKNITLLSLNPVNPIQSAKALLYSSREIEFAEMVLVANEKPSNLPSSIKFVKTEARTHRDTSVFTYIELPDLINTEYCLQVHDDGFVTNPHLWTDEFLKYDYIGAPWKPDCFGDGMPNRVGNGGFVLKSNKFIQLTRNLRYLGGHDDVELSINYYNYFISQGCKYAPVELAMRFSLESKIPDCEYNLDNCFGFHGRGHPSLTCVHDGEYQQFQDKCKLLETIEL
jgi:hypothetical protein